MASAGWQMKVVTRKLACTAHRRQEAVNCFGGHWHQGMVMRSDSLGSIVRMERKGKSHCTELTDIWWASWCWTGRGQRVGSDSQAGRQEKPSEATLWGFTHHLLPVFSPPVSSPSDLYAFPLEHDSRKYLCSIMSWQSLLPSKFISWELLLGRECYSWDACILNNFEAFEN